MSSFVEESDLEIQEAPELSVELAIPEVALVPEHLSPDALSIIPPETEMRALVQLAVTLSAAELVPKALRDKPNDTLLVLLTARDLGIKLTTALRLCYPIDGQVTVAPKLKLAIIRERKVARVWPDPANNAEQATWYAVRADDPETTFASTFTWEDAQRPTGRSTLVDPACTLGEHASSCKCKDNWKNYPARMLSWRALGYLMDDACGEVGAGLYSPDELGAITDEEGVAILDVTEVGPLEGTSEPRSMAQARRKREKAAAGDPSAAPASDEQKALLGRMMRALPEPGVDAGKALWVNAVGVKIADLAVAKAKTARALLDSLWKRAEAGEWGAWERPFDPDAPTGSEAAGGPEGAPGPETAQEDTQAESGAAGQVSDEAQATPAAGTEELADIDAVIDWTSGLDIAEVEERLAALAEPVEGGGENDKRRALAVRVARDLGLV